jgi:hypothetical protein
MLKIQLLDAFALQLHQRAQMEHLRQQNADERADDESGSALIEATDDDREHNREHPRHSRRGRILIGLHGICSLKSGEMKSRKKAQNPQQS